MPGTELVGVEVTLLTGQNGNAMGQQTRYVARGATGPMRISEFRALSEESQFVRVRLRDSTGSVASNRSQLLSSKPSNGNLCDENSDCPVWTVLALPLLGCVLAGCGRLGFDALLEPGTDASLQDAGLDASMTSDGRVTPSCGSLTIDADTVAYWDFAQRLPIPGLGSDPSPLAADLDDGAVPDACSIGFPPSPCGQALAIPDGNKSYLYAVRPGNGYALAEGSIDVRFQLLDAGANGALVGQDASGGSRGHFTLLVDQQRVVARIQTATGNVYLCNSEDLSVSDWHEVTMNFGPARAALFVDGVRATGGVTPLGTVINYGIENCDDSSASTQIGSSALFTIGTSNHRSIEGGFDDDRSSTGDGVQRYANDMLIDAVRLSRVRRLE